MTNLKLARGNSLLRRYARFRAGSLTLVPAMSACPAGPPASPTATIFATATVTSLRTLTSLSVGVSSDAVSSSIPLSFESRGTVPSRGKRGK